MTKQEAIKAMKEGKKVTHKYFSRDEWMTMENGKIVLEDGVKCCPDMFWQWRLQEHWNNGYELFKTQ